MAGVEPAVPVEGAVPLGVGVVPGGLAVGADECPEDWTGDTTVGSLKLVAAALLQGLTVGETELAPVASRAGDHDLGLHCHELTLQQLSTDPSVKEQIQRSSDLT